MRVRLRILGQGLFAAVLAFAFAPQAVGQDTIVYATDYTNHRIWAVDVTSGSAPTLVTNTAGVTDSLIFAPNGDILYTLTQLGELGSFDGTTNTIVASGLGTPGDLTLEPSGTSVLVSNVNGASVLRVDLITGHVTTLFQQSQFYRFDGITYDNNGNLFVVANFNQVLQISPTIPNTVINQSPIKTCNPGTTCLDGMTFDPVTGDLWISFSYSGGIVSIPTSLSGFSGPFATNIPNPDGLEADGKGNIYVAAELTNIYQYNIAMQMTTQLQAVPGLDDLAPLTGSGSRPTGYVEICKAANAQFPPPNQVYDFTLTAPFFSFGPIQVPLGDCSGAVQVPAGTTCPNCLTITESPVLGVLVSDVTAIAYNSLGMQIPELIGWNSPDLSATVGVQGGDVSLETLATFTNYNVGQNGQLKICKIAGPGTQVGTNFYFIVNTFFPVYDIPAGPPDQGGYCQVVRSYPVNTQVNIFEQLYLTPGYQVSNIAVECNGCTYTIQSPTNVLTTIGAGITEVDYTDIPAPFYTNLGTGGNYRCSPLGWPVAGSGSPGGTSYTQAAEFSSQRNGNISQINVAVAPVSGVNSFFVALYTSNGNLPGTEIGEWPYQVAVGCPGIVSITGITGVSLTAGTNYFLVVGPMTNSSTTYERWNLNNLGATGTHLYATSGCSNGSGNGCSWNSLGTQTLAAFEIQ